MFEELMKTVEIGNVVRVLKGAVSIALNIENIEVYVDDNTQIELNLVGCNSVYVFDDDNITKVNNPHGIAGNFKFCYRIVDEEDGVFYITDK